MSALDEIVSRLTGMPLAQRAELARAALQGTAHMQWVPNPGPQTEAYLTEADILLYGGQAGGGKSQLLVGWGVNEAQIGIIFRRELSQTDGLERDAKAIIGRAAGFNGTDHEWAWPDGKTLKLGGMRMADDWISHAGRERDYIAFDEAGEFLEVQVVSIRAWLRASPGRRTRMILASNPPRTAEGLWMIEWFAPWLDDRFPSPAKPGELRWAVYVSDTNGAGRTVWVDGPGEYEIDGETYTAASYTFIPASLEDNPYRNTPEYRAKLQALPEPLRSQLLKGDFRAGLKDAANQAIPTAWIRAAIARWKSKPPEGVPMCAIGVDCSGGGDDPMVLALRHDGWFPPLVEIPGATLPPDHLGSYAAGMVVAHRRDEAEVVIDLGGGYGGSAYEHLKQNNVSVTGYKGAEASARRSRDGKLKFTNKRSEAYWLFREALDPGQPGGSPIALPDDPALIADLAAPTFEVTAQGIKLEPKEKVVARLGRSTDRGDAVVMAWSAGPKEITHALEWAKERERRKPLGRMPQVIMSRPPLTRRH